MVLTGVGGQGIITMATLLANAALNAGHEALVAETHGLSQRGGTVIVHVRMGHSVYSPLVPRGAADVLIALEPLEALRYIDYLSDSGVLVVNTYSIPPPLPGVKPPKPEEVVEALKISGVRVYAVNATSKAIEIGDARTANTYLLGYVLGLGGFQGIISLEDFEEAIRRLGRLVEKNIEALHQGYSDAKKLSASSQILNRANTSNGMGL